MEKKRVRRTYPEILADLQEKREKVRSALRALDKRIANIENRAMKRQYAKMLKIIRSGKVSPEEIQAIIDSKKKETVA